MCNWITINGFMESLGNLQTIFPPTHTHTTAMHQIEQSFADYRKQHLQADIK